MLKSALATSGLPSERSPISGVGVATTPVMVTPASTSMRLSTVPPMAWFTRSLLDTLRATASVDEMSLTSISRSRSSPLTTTSLLSVTICCETIEPVAAMLATLPVADRLTAPVASL